MQDLRVAESQILRDQCESWSVEILEYLTAYPLSMGI
jgi:hypothetical protein